MVTDVQAAHAAGIEFVGVTHGFASRDELVAAGAQHVIDSLDELPGLLAKS
jgi:phosphoglycolate phosphatase-like HAD superfamily hydrolase